MREETHLLRAAQEAAVHAELMAHPALDADPEAALAIAAAAGFPLNNRQPALVLAAALRRK